MRAAIASLLTACAALALANSARAQAGEKYALLVGVREYDPNELRPLLYTDNDMTALADVLRQAGFRRVVLMTQSAGARQARYLPLAANVRKELRGMLEDRREGDTVCVAFAGHGVQFAGQPEPYFCPMDARLKDKSTLIALGEVYKELRSSKASLKLLLVDACRNDPLSDFTRSRAEVRLESVSRPQQARPPEGVAAIFSCSEGEKAFESPTLKHGVFFHAVIQGLKGKAAGRDGDVTLYSLLDYVTRDVTDQVKDEFGADQRQRPELVGKASGPLPLVRVAVAKARPNPVVAVETSMGRIELELFPDKAPVTVKNFLQYVDNGFYDGTIFHRVIGKENHGVDFMIQGGGYTPAKLEKTTREPIQSESNNGLSNTRGMLTAARVVSKPDSATSQFFINVVDNPSLDRANFKDGVGFCVFGKVIEGMDVVDKIKAVPTQSATFPGMKDPQPDVPVTDVLIKSIRRVSR